MSGVYICGLEMPVVGYINIRIRANGTGKILDGYAPRGAKLQVIPVQDKELEAQQLLIEKELMRKKIRKMERERQEADRLIERMAKELDKLRHIRQLDMSEIVQLRRQIELLVSQETARSCDSRRD